MMIRISFLVGLLVFAIAPARAGVIVYTPDVDFGGASFGGGEATGVAEYVPNYGATAADFTGFTAGHIAVIDRGVVLFAEKVQNAQDAGAIGVIVLDAPPLNPSLGMGGSSATIIIPSVRIAESLGDALRAELLANLSTPIVFHLSLSPLTLERFEAVPEPSALILSSIMLGVAGAGWSVRTLRRRSLV
ncbi:PA domain-containing protein [Paludisphaera borealis]|uniref:PA domain-containing protein n=1 Tax=Paludisphaera borealis TaxID=1387353 RepID=A0A1U7CS78_9BACT|nr:PA domain-containing protein [Paludisphaera borealis]APW61795.1 hypothetical protein BSF38_03324 [Paludisphaera borealis]